MTHANDAKTQGLPDKIAERIAALFNGDISHGKNISDVVRSELLGSELVKAAEYALSGDALKGALRLRAALNALKEKKNG